MELYVLTVLLNGEKTATTHNDLAGLKKAIMAAKNENREIIGAGLYDTMKEKVTKWLPELIGDHSI